MDFEVNINLKWFCGISNWKNFDHCWQQSKTMLLCDDVVVKLVLVIKWVRKVINWESTPICCLPLATITDSMMFSCPAGNSSMYIYIYIYLVGKIIKTSHQLSSSIKQSHWWTVKTRPTTLVTRVGKIHVICILHLPTPVQCWQKHFHLTQVFILPFSNIERGDWIGDAGTYSVGITVMSLCFWHFPTQFVHGCR